ncbi:mRNA-capping enzyme [Glycine max]|nr:mRNA-capping enzyme [Glycine max]
MWLEDENSTKGFQLGSSTNISHRQSANSCAVSYYEFFMQHNNEDTHRGLKRKPPHMDRGQERRPYNTNSRPYDRNTVPDGWLDCPPHGQEIGCIIPSKVPLGDSFNDYIPSQKYAPKQAIHQQRVLGRELGLVIDLTNTTRYYPVSDWTKEGIGHAKIGCTGRDAVPDDESVKFFCDKAINKFACARHPGIYKQDYIDALYMFYNEKKPEDLVCPQTPEWKRISDPDFRGTAVPAVDNSAHIPEQERIVRNEVLTSDDALGDPIPPNQLRPMQELCYQLLKLGTGGRGRSFPGSHPVSLNRDNLQLLRQRYYYATWKADGTRYMMLITCDGTPERNHHYTLLDGEMIIDTDPHTHKQERRYLIYDLMAINQVSLTELPFYERWKLLEKEVIEPRNMEREGLSKSINPYYRYDLEPFSVRRKGFWLLSTVSKLLHKFIPQLSHSSDGLVFQGWDDPYVPRTHEGLLKWKYPEMNSVDFLCEVVQVGAGDRPLLFLFERGRKKLMEENVIFKDASDISSYSGKIIECYWDSAEHHWVCMRIRIDKAAPNDINTYRKVMRSIKDNITEEVLLNEINQIIRLPLYADRIQRDIKAHQHMISSSSRRK